MSLLLLHRAGQATLDLNFLSGLPPQTTFSRASSGWYFDASRALVQASSNIPRFDYDPVTGAAKGLRLEEQRQNVIRVSDASGSVNGALGSGGSLPTNWNCAAVSGITVTVIGAGTVNGIPYVDIRFQTANAGATSLNLRFETNTGIIAASGQSWTSSLYVQRTLGNNSGITNFQIATVGMNSSAVDQESSTTNFTPSTSLQRPYCARTLSNASTTNLSPRFVMNFASAAVFNITLRFALPQAEQGVFPTSPIVTNGTALTRAADSVAISNISNFYLASGGTLYSECQLSGMPSATAFPRLVSFNDNTINNEISLYLNTSANALAGIIKNATVNQAETSATTPVTSFVENVLIKQSMRFANNDVAIANNGSAVQADNTVSLPAVSQLNFFRITNSYPASGWLRRVRYWNYGLDNANLTRITT